MTPDERALLTRFLSDLAQVRGAAKDLEAATLIEQAAAKQPDALYLLVQHSLLADQALHAAQDRIADLEDRLRAPTAQPASSFLGAAPPPPSPWNQGQPSYQTAVPPIQPSGFFGGGAPAAPGGFGSFLRNAGTTAAGIAGGAFLFEGLSNLFGGGHSGGFFGGGYGGGFGQPMENVTINNYGDDNGGGVGGGDYDAGGGDDWSDDNSGNDFS